MTNQWNEVWNDADDPPAAAANSPSPTDRGASPEPRTDECGDCEKLRDQLARLQAEFINYKRRVARDYQKSRDEAAADVMQLLLPTLDNLEQALKASPEESSQTEDQLSYHQGIGLIYEDLRATLATEGLEQLDLRHTEFDPATAEAVGVVEAPGFGSGIVIDIIQSGWLFRGKLLRPAKVLVNRVTAPAIDPY